MYISNVLQINTFCERPLCHRNSFNPWCDVHGIFFLKSSYVSLIFKSRLVVKILASPFLRYILPPEGVIILYGEKPNQTCSEKFKNGINLPHLWYKVFLYDLKGLRIIARSRKPKPLSSSDQFFVGGALVAVLLWRCLCGGWRWLK